MGDEQTWYLRLWALVANGQSLEALAMARLAGSRLPGSAAVAYLRAVLEMSAGTPLAAVVAAERAAALTPGHPLSDALIAALAAHPAGQAQVTSLDEEEPSATPATFDPFAAAMAGTALLQPFRSLRPLRPALPPPIAQPQRTTSTGPGRRFGIIAIGTIGAALWAVHDPLPAALALAAIVAWVARRS
jgi:hypothetical protein